jgi:two-component system sensor histidine kinase HydH
VAGTLVLSDGAASNVLDRVFAAMEDMVVVWGPDGRVVTSNLGARARTLEDPIAAGLRCHEALLGVERRCDQACPVERVREGAAQNASIEIYDDQRDRTFEVRAFAVRGGYTLELVRDVSERRRAEETRRRAERRSAVDTLAAGLAHEARNPLNSAGLQLLLLERALERSPDCAPMLARARAVREELARLERLMREFIDFSRPLEMKSSPVEAPELLESVRASVALRAEAAGVELRSASAEGAPAIPADRQRLEQALLNLVVNAVEATAAGGRVDVRACKGPLGLRIEVQDGGPGIAPEARERMFDLFFTTKPAGTGLGLAIVRKIVEEHGGVLTWESGPGEGALFRVDLPAAARAPAAVARR